jgi:hypothetical protein
MKLKIFCHCSLFSSWSGTSVHVLLQTGHDKESLPITFRAGTEGK